jgi:hypothetical protein
MSEGKWEEPCIGPGCTFSPWCNFRKYWDAGKKKECNLSDSDLAAIRECIEDEGKRLVAEMQSCRDCRWNAYGIKDCTAPESMGDCNFSLMELWEPQGEGE